MNSKKRTRYERHGGTKRPEYRIWRAMLERCENKNNKSYKDYGDRGVTVCERWRESFASFLEDIGSRPDGHTIERIDVNVGYCKENCRWATRFDQARNKTNSRLLAHGGITKCLSDWAMEKTSPVTRIKDRIDKLGWTVDEAISTDRVDGRILTVNGISQTTTAWAKEMGFDRSIIKDRLRMGWSEEDAVMKPVKKLDRGGLFFMGKTQSKVEWSRETGIPRETIHARLRHGWSIEKTLTTPVARKK